MWDRRLMVARFTHHHDSRSSSHKYLKCLNTRSKNNNKKQEINEKHDQNHGTLIIVFEVVRASLYDLCLVVDGC